MDLCCHVGARDHADVRQQWFREVRARKIAVCRVEFCAWRKPAEPTSQCGVAAVCGEHGERLSRQGTGSCNLSRKHRDWQQSKTSRRGSLVEPRKPQLVHIVLGPRTQSGKGSGRAKGPNLREPSCSVRSSFSGKCRSALQRRLWQVWRGLLRSNGRAKRLSVYVFSAALLWVWQQPQGLSSRISCVQLSSVDHRQNTGSSSVHK